MATSREVTILSDNPTSEVSFLDDGSYITIVNLPFGGGGQSLRGDIVTEHSINLAKTLRKGDVIERGLNDGGAIVEITLVRRAARE